MISTAVGEMHNHHNGMHTWTFGHFLPGQEEELSVSCSRSSCISKAFHSRIQVENGSDVDACDWFPASDDVTAVLARSAFSYSIALARSARPV